MMKKIATGILAIAATSAVALSLPSAASATTADFDDYSDYWGPVYAKQHLAKAQGHVSVEWDEEDSNEVHVTGRLYDLDDRDYDEGGKCDGERDVRNEADRERLQQRCGIRDRRHDQHTGEHGPGHWGLPL